MSPKKSIGVVVVLIGVVAIVWAATSFSRAVRGVREPSSSAAVPLPENEIVAGYRRWTRVNPVPVLMQSAVAALCADIRQLRTDHENPHRDKYITVYVNDTGRQAMIEEKAPRFPLNTVIVKEKLTNKDSSVPELLTVMIKRETGYDAQNGDWEYMVLDGSAKTVQASGKLPACQSCHMMAKSTDYVSRSYLPPEVLQKLK